VGTYPQAVTGGESSIKGIGNEWYTLSEGLYRAYLAIGFFRDEHQLFFRYFQYVSILKPSFDLAFSVVEGEPPELIISDFADNRCFRAKPGQCRKHICRRTPPGSSRTAGFRLPMSHRV
jgi:hypothetical protein